jgi:hypothetical protein
VAENTSKSIVVDHRGYKFGFTRDQKGSGYWYCLSSKSTIYGSGIGYIVPRQYWAEILSSAIKQGIDSSLLYYNPPETPKKSAVSSNSKKPAISSTTRSVKEESGIKIF